MGERFLELRWTLPCGPKDYDKSRGKETSSLLSDVPLSIQQVMSHGQTALSRPLSSLRRGTPNSSRFLALSMQEVRRNGAKPGRSLEEP